MIQPWLKQPNILHSWSLYSNTKNKTDKHIYSVMPDSDKCQKKSKKQGKVWVIFVSKAKEGHFEM